MNYNEAHNFVYNEIDNEDSLKIILFLAEDKTQEGLQLIKQLTSCDDNTAKLLWVDLKCDYGTVENNPILKAQSELSSEEIAYNNAVERELQNKPKCPICQSTNLSKISATKKAMKVAAFGIFGMGDNGKTWKCNNCGSKF